MRVGKLTVYPKDLQLKHWATFKIEPIKGKRALETMKRGCEVMAKTESHFWISSGNLLGVYRDKKLIDHDTDIDVNVLFKWDSLEANLKSQQILLGLVANDFIVIRTIVYKNHFMQLAFLDKKTDVIFDVCFYYSGIKPLHGVFMDVDGYIAKPLRFIKKLGTLKYEGVSYPVPEPLSEFLRWRFGNNWKIPSRGKVPWQNESPNLIRWA